MHKLGDKAIRSKIVAASLDDSRAGCTDLADRLLRPAISKLNSQRQHSCSVEACFCFVGCIVPCRT
jgi:hypothetical protein